MAYGRAYGHNFVASGAASGQNLAFDHNEIFELIVAFDHVKLVGQISLVSLIGISGFGLALGLIGLVGLMGLAVSLLDDL